jgi:hypothetical protein
LRYELYVEFADKMKYLRTNKKWFFSKLVGEKDSRILINLRGTGSAGRRCRFVDDPACGAGRCGAVRFIRPWRANKLATLHRRINPDP